MFSKEEEALLSLSVRERKIISALDVLKQASMQDLALHLKVPRTSLYWPVLQLEKRNIVGHERVGKRKRYFARTGEIKLRKKLGSLESALGDMRIVEGVENIKELYNASLDIHPGERVLILEGNLALHSIREKSGLAFMISWHDRVIARGIILESLLGERLHDDLRAGRIDPQVIQSLSRFNLWVGYMVADEWINVDAALVLFRDVAIVTDWSNERAVVINNQSVVRLLRNFCEAFKAIGRKVDLAQEMRKAALLRN